MASLNILFIGETNIVHMIEHKGLDAFELTRYVEFASIIGKVFKDAGHSFTHIPCHDVHGQFPKTLEELKAYDVVILSDVGSNTMLLFPDYLNKQVNSLKMIKDFVADGGGFVMIGGYLSYTGFQAKARYKGTHIEDILPVELLASDDRTEMPEGSLLEVAGAPHPILDGMPEAWPHIFGYNRTTAKPDAQVLVTANGGDPVIAAGTFGAGHTVAYTTDCVQDWAPPELLNWPHYQELWDRILHWSAGKERSGGSQ